MLQHGLDITGEKNGYDFIKNIAHHHFRSALPLITQECLLLAGSKDRYVPQKRLKDMTKELIQAKRVVTKLFTEKTGGALHCQIDDIKPALEEITAFLASKPLNVAHH